MMETKNLIFTSFKQRNNLSSRQLTCIPTSLPYCNNYNEVMRFRGYFNSLLLRLFCKKIEVKMGLFH